MAALYTTLHDTTSQSPHKWNKLLDKDSDWDRMCIHGSQMQPNIDNNELVKCSTCDDNKNVSGSSYTCFCNEHIMSWCWKHTKVKRYRNL